VDTSPFGLAWSILYLEVRINYLISNEKELQQNEFYTFPLQFQRGLIASLREQKVDFKDTILNYANLFLNMKQAVSENPKYDKKQSFWFNSVVYLLDLLRAFNAP
jgi:hypothetical protein